METQVHEKSEEEQKVSKSSPMLIPARTGPGRGAGFANWHPAVSNCNAERSDGLRRLGGASIMFMSLILSMLMLAAPAQADRVSFEIALAGPSNVQTARVGGAVISVETRSIGSTVLYRLVNTGADWPGQIAVSIAKAGVAKPVIAKSFSLKRGQIATFRVKTSVPHPAMELRLSPSWSGESHVHVYQHNASQNVLASVAGMRNRGVVRRASFYIQ